MLVKGTNFWAVESDLAASNSGPISGAVLNGANLLTWLHVTTAHKPEAIMIATTVLRRGSLTLHPPEVGMQQNGCWLNPSQRKATHAS